MRASDRAYRTLLDEIQSGRLAPGVVLGEVEQAARLGVSRTPLREALGRLAADGLVVQQSPRVTVVSDLDAGDIRELFEVRRALEETAARLAAARGDAATFATLADEFAGAPLDGAAAADDYYRLIARFDDRPRRRPSPTTTSPRRCAASAPTSCGCAGSHATIRGRLAASVAEHRLIASAIAARDADLAAHATHVHLHNALASILESLADLSEGAPATSGGTRTTHIHQGAA